MRLASIRRYPVKGMGGESLDSVALDARGVVGDRWFAVEDAEGRFASGKNTRRFRRHDEIFDFAATMTDEGVRVRDLGDDAAAPAGWMVGDPALDASLSERFGEPMRVLPESDERHQDGGQVSLIGTATLAWFSERWGIDADPRRLRVNLVVETDDPFVEESWVGRDVSIGDAVLTVVERVPRCRTIDLAQDGSEASGRWLKPLASEREGCAAVYLDVRRPGSIAVGDAVTA